MQIRVYTSINSVYVVSIRCFLFSFLLVSLKNMQIWHIHLKFKLKQTFLRPWLSTPLRVTCELLRDIRMRPTLKDTRVLIENVKKMTALFSSFLNKNSITEILNNCIFQNEQGKWSFQATKRIICAKTLINALKSHDLLYIFRVVNYN